jgi:hypothetical protein
MQLGMIAANRVFDMEDSEDQIHRYWKRTVPYRNFLVT